MQIRKSMRINGIFIWLCICPSVLVSVTSDGPLKMNKDLQYNCYYQILRMYTPHADWRTKTEEDWDDETDYSRRLAHPLYLSVPDNLRANATAARARRRVRRQASAIGSEDDVSGDKSTNAAYRPTNYNYNLPATSSASSSSNFYRINGTSNPQDGHALLVAPQPSYFIVAAKTLQPGRIYPVSVTLLLTPHDVKVYANISCDGMHLSGASVDVQQDSSETLYLRLPSDTTLKRACELRLEGFFLNVFCDSAFLQSRPLSIEPPKLLLYVQTERLLYKCGDVLRFRVAVLDSDFRATDAVVEITIVDPKLRSMQRWLLKLLEGGTKSLQYKLPHTPMHGAWQINVSTVALQPQQQSKVFYVEHYETSFIDLEIKSAVILPATLPQLPVQVLASAINGDQQPKGNLTLLSFVRPWGFFNMTGLNAELREHIAFENTYVNSNMHTAVINDSWSLSVLNFNGGFNFNWPMPPVTKPLEVLFTATMTADSSHQPYSAYAITRLLPAQVRLYFLGDSPQIFKSTMPFTAYLLVEHLDGSPLTPLLLKSARVQVKASLEINGQQLKWTLEQLKMLHQEGLTAWQLFIDLPNESEVIRHPQLRRRLSQLGKLQLQATFTAAGNLNASADLLLVPHFSPRQQFLKVTSSTEHPAVGEYMIFHVSCNFYLEQFHYLLMSKGVILLNEREYIHEGARTLAVVLSSEMAPSATLVVWSVNWQGQVVVDALTFAIADGLRLNLSVSLQAKTTRNVETYSYMVNTKAEPGVHVALTSYNKEVSNMWQSNALNYENLLFGNHVKSSRAKEYFVYHPVNTFGVDASRVFELSNLLVLTDGVVPRRSGKCNPTKGYMECTLKDCFKKLKKCDGHRDCADGSDESGCMQQLHVDATNEFDLYRVNRLRQHYEDSVLWQDFNIGASGHYSFALKTLSILKDHTISAYSTSLTRGTSVWQGTTHALETTPFSIEVYLPKLCRAWEHVGLRLNIKNLRSSATMIAVTLLNSADYKFVEQDIGHAPLFYSADSQFLLQLLPDATRMLHIPLMPLERDQTSDYEIKVKLLIESDLGKQKVTRILRLRPTAAQSKVFHQIVPLDLTQVRYAVQRLGSLQKARPRVTILGNSFGVTGQANVPMPNVDVDTAEPHLFAFASTLYTLAQFRELSERNSSMEKRLLVNLHNLYGNLLQFQRLDGSFAYFAHEQQSSVWLTVHCIRVLQDVYTYNLDKLLRLDIEATLTQSLAWLLSAQSPQGAFNELNNAIYTSAHCDNLTLTSHVISTLACVAHIPPALSSRLQSVQTLALRWLTDHADQLIHAAQQQPHTAAVLGYALQLANSSLAERILPLLQMLAQGSDSVPITLLNHNDSTAFKRLNSSKTAPFQLDYDSEGLETKAYTLMTLVQRRGFDSSYLVNWLNAQRVSIYGWATERQTSLALKALLEVTRNSYAKESTALTLEVEAAASQSKRKIVQSFYITNANLTKLNSLELPKNTSQLSITARGIGYALLHVEAEERNTTGKAKFAVQGHFALYNHVTLRGADFRQISYKTCVSWVNMQALASARMVVLDITTPTGYGIEQQQLNAYVRQQSVRHLLHAKVQELQVRFYFRKLDRLETCIDLTISRWFPVANLSSFLPISVYHYGAPEQYTSITYDLTPLHRLGVCDVCGSSRCTRCQTFNRADKFAVQNIHFFIFFCSIQFAVFAKRISISTEY